MGMAYEVNLDRLLTRQVSIPGTLLPGATYRYTERDTSVGGINGPGEYYPDGVNWFMHVTDADGLTLPAVDSLTLGDAVTIVGAEFFNHATTLVAYEQARNAFGQVLPNIIVMELASAPTALPAAPEVVITLPTGGISAPTEGEQKVWAGIRDFTGRDQLNIGDGSNFSLSDTRVLVRADGSWDVGDTFTLDGQRLTVRGIARVGGRRQYLELLSRG